MDKLEKFIRENREGFDREMPSLKVWADIDRALEARQTRRVSLWKPLRAVAAVAALLIIGAGAGVLLFRSDAALPPEIAEMEQFYNQQVEQKMAQLARYETSGEVEADLNQIDGLIAELQEELASAPKGQEEQIIEAMIRNYQTKLEILERVLERIRETNPKTTQPAADETSI